MNAIRKWRKAALAILALVVVAQVAASVLVRTHAGREFLLRHLERAFGRPIEVRQFEASVFPRLRLDAAGISVGEDPAFGNEYFLRADNFSAALRWLGLLRGRFEFGTISFSRPSLILVRSSNRRWNLERWLPPAPRRTALPAHAYGPEAPPQPANHLQKIEFDEGRINFKFGEDKLPFAFTGVSGSVEQLANGRWELQLDAQPWRSGVQLQSTGTLSVRGGIAGTSARLQPAAFRVHWEDASLADLFRLLRGQDYGVRGSFALDATAQSGSRTAELASAQAGEWSFAVNARAARIHRWDLSERTDNPRISTELEGRWNPASGAVVADRWVINTPRSNLRGTAQVLAAAGGTPELRVEGAAVQGADLLAWYRAFHPGVAEDLSWQQFFSGSMALGGRPLAITAGNVQSDGGSLRVPGFASPVRLGVVRGGVVDGRLVIQPVTLSWTTAQKAEAAARTEAARTTRFPGQNGPGKMDAGLTEDLSSRSGAVSITGSGVESEDVLRLLAALGRPVNHGWELQGTAAAALRWAWSSGKPADWEGAINVSHASLQVAGLNEPISIGEATLSFPGTGRRIHFAKTSALGAVWTGNVFETFENGPSASTNTAGAPPSWKFDLHADRLSAADLDHWIGPRARPGWLERLLPALLGGSPSAVPPASDLLRQLNALGTLRVDEFAVEKIRVKDLLASVAVHGLSLDVDDASGQWAGGTLHGHLSADFAPSPRYEIAVRFERVNLAALPFADGVTQRAAGLASGTLRLTASGVGRESLLGSLEGSGEFRTGSTQFRGWDVDASLAGGGWRSGASHWSSGEGDFRIQDRQVDVERFRLSGARGAVVLRGTIGFGRDADLTLEPAAARPGRAAAAPEARILHIRGFLGSAVEEAGSKQR